MADDIILCFEKVERILRQHLEHRHTVPEYVWFSVRVVQSLHCYTCSEIIIDYEFENLDENLLDNPVIRGNLSLKLTQWRNEI